MELIISPTGVARYLYDESLDLRGLGQLTITRASQVEPDDQGQWWADLSLVAGPSLGPFFRRSEALAAEVAWLTANRLLPTR